MFDQTILCRIWVCRLQGGEARVYKARVFYNPAGVRSMPGWLFCKNFLNNLEVFLNCNLFG